MTTSDPRRGLGRRLGMAAAAVLALAAASQQRAEALSLATPGTAPSAKYASDGITTEVRGGHGHGGGGGFRGGGGGGFRGGGGGFHGGGGFRGGGAAFHGGGFRAAPAFRAAPVFRGGGGYYRAAPVLRGGGYRYGYRQAYHRPHFHHRRVYAPRYYGYPVYHGYRHRYCRVIWTYYGPRKICKYRPWYRHHWRPRIYGIPLRYW
ncbi:MAG: hypothetical protein PS018_05150 [bacterium]|nr:hypothetical protein [bacterium]